MSGEKTYGPGNDNYGRDKKLFQLDAGGEQTKLSVKSILDVKFEQIIDTECNLLSGMIHKQTLKCMHAAHTHALANSNLIELDKVVEVLLDKVTYLKMAATNTTKEGKYGCSVAINQLEDCIEQIKKHKTIKQ